MKIDETYFLNESYFTGTETEDEHEVEIDKDTTSYQFQYYFKLSKETARPHIGKITNMFVSLSYSLRNVKTVSVTDIQYEDNVIWITAGTDLNNRALITILEILANMQHVVKQITEEDILYYEIGEGNNSTFVSGTLLELLLIRDTVVSSYDKATGINTYMFRPSEMASYEEVIAELHNWFGIPVVDCDIQLRKFFRGASPSFSMEAYYLSDETYSGTPDCRALTDTEVINSLNKFDFSSLMEAGLYDTIEFICDARTNRSRRSIGNVSIKSIREEVVKQKPIMYKYSATEDKYSKVIITGDFGAYQYKDTDEIYHVIVVIRMNTFDDDSDNYKSQLKTIASMSSQLKKSDIATLTNFIEQNAKY